LELAERPGQILRFGVACDEVKNSEVPFRVTDSSSEVFELKEANVAMVVLKRFDLQLGAILGIQFKAFVGAVIRGQVLVKARLLELHQGLVAHGPFAIGSPGGIHLQEAEVNSKLDFLLSVFAGKPADYDLPRLVLPAVEEVRYVEIHEANMAGRKGQVNAGTNKRFRVV
jgi:hypothetical protein